MHLISHAVWCLMGVVFPRQNETYAPMERFPIVFALQNAELAKHLQPLIKLDVLNGSMTMLDKINERNFDLEWANYSSEPYLIYGFMDFEIEGPLKLLWTAWWRRCDESGDEVRIISNSSDQLWVDFDIREGAQKADLVAATAEGNMSRTCGSRGQRDGQDTRCSRTPLRPEHTVWYSCSRGLFLSSAHLKPLQDQDRQGNGREHGGQ
ncbi:hypothetical protein S40288_10932 [Stachybotrys chartarum IBT 40288]|nr:hypothetical protein S40288_10932 [Stachybotrys chartarum IBT 40288]